MILQTGGGDGGVLHLELINHWLVLLFHRIEGRGGFRAPLFYEIRVAVVRALGDEKALLCEVDVSLRGRELRVGGIAGGFLEQCERVRGFLVSIVSGVEMSLLDLLALPVWHRCVLGTLYGVESRLRVLAVLVALGDDGLLLRDEGVAGGIEERRIREGAADIDARERAVEQIIEELALIRFPTAGERLFRVLLAVGHGALGNFEPCLHSGNQVALRENVLVQLHEGSRVGYTAPLLEHVSQVIPGLCDSLSLVGDILIDCSLVGDDPILGI